MRKKPISLEPLRLEHGYPEVPEDGYGHREQDDVDGAHTRSSSQMSVRETAAKPTIPITERRSGMLSMVVRAPSTGPERHARPHEQFVNEPTWGSARAHRSTSRAYVAMALLHWLMVAAGSHPVPLALSLANGVAW